MSKNATDQTSWAIYGLRHKGEAEYRYIGLTRVGIDRRLKLHKYDAKKAKRHVSHWINKNSDDIVIEVVEECPAGDEEYLFDAEVRWIAHFRDLGHRLTNSSDGGASGSYGARWTISEENRRSGENHPMYGRSMSDETKSALSRARVGTTRTIESRVKQSASISGENHWTSGIDLVNVESGRTPGYVYSDEVRAKISEARRRQAPPSEDTRRKISEAHKGKVLSTDHRAKISVATMGEKHHAYGKPPVNKGVPMSDEQKEKNRLTLPKTACAKWHLNRNYVDPQCVVCVDRVASGEAVRFSTPEEIAAAKEVWKSNRDPEKLAAYKASLSASHQNRSPVSDETKAKLSAARKGVKMGPISEEHRAKLSAAKKGRSMGEAQQRGMMLGLHKKWHADRGRTKPGCEFCEV